MRPPTLAHDQRNEFAEAALHHPSCAIEHGSAFAGWRRLPGTESRRRACHRRFGVRNGGFNDVADHIGTIGGRRHRTALTNRLVTTNHRRGKIIPTTASGDLSRHGFKCCLVLHVDSFAIGPLRAKKMGRKRNTGMRFARQCRDVLDRIGQQHVDRQTGIGDAIHERGVGAVFEQAPRQVGQQLFVVTDRRIDPASAIPLVLAHHFAIQFAAHAVQALVFPFVAADLDGDLGHCGQCVCVMRGEGREESHRIGQKAPRAGQIAHVGRILACEDGVTGQPALLRQLDFGIPIGALDQAYGQTPLGTTRQIGQPIDRCRRTFLIGLHRQPQAIPPGEFAVERQKFDQVERKLEAVGFLRVDREADVLRFRPQGQRLDRRPELAPHAFFVGRLIARMERRQFDRYRGCGQDVTARDANTDAFDGQTIRLEVAQRISAGARGFAQHVEAVPVATESRFARPGDRFVDGAPHHELLAEDANGRDDGLADHRFAGARHHPAERTAEMRVLVLQAHDASGEHQRPGTGVDENAVGDAEAFLPFGAANLVTDQPIHRLGVWDAQQRLSQAHQHDALA